MLWATQMILSIVIVAQGKFTIFLIEVTQRILKKDEQCCLKHPPVVLGQEFEWASEVNSYLAALLMELLLGTCT